MTNKQMNQLRASYASIGTITVDDYLRLKATIGRLGQSDIEQLAGSGIKFVNTAANSVLCDRKIRPESARWEHAIDTITDSLIVQRATTEAA